MVGKKLGMMDCVGFAVGAFDSVGPAVGTMDNVGLNVGEEVGRSPHSSALEQMMHTSSSVCRTLPPAGLDDSNPLIHLHWGRNPLPSVPSEYA